jgi:hypothetical protein
MKALTVLWKNLILVIEKNCMQEIPKPFKPPLIYPQELVSRTVAIKAAISRIPSLDILFERKHTEMQLMRFQLCLRVLNEENLSAFGLV